MRSLPRRGSAAIFIVATLAGLSSIYRPDRSFGGTASYQWLTFERACVSVNGTATGPTGPDANCGLNSDGNSGAITISADGRFVAFEAQATDLVTPNTDSGRFNIFVRDLKNQTTALVSHDVSVATTDGNGNSEDAHISADGNWISFISAASNLIASDTNGQTDIFVYSVQSGNIVRVVGPNTANSGSFLSTISGDGRYVFAYTCDSNDYAVSSCGVIVHDRDVDNSGTYDTPAIRATPSCRP